MTDLQKNIVIIVLIAVIGALLLYFSGALSNSKDGYLFVQNARSGNFKPVKNTQTGEYKLSLMGIFPFTHYFSDRPQRIAGNMNNEEFFALENFFDEKNPPNAAVVLSNADSAGQDVIIVELLKSEYEPTRRRVIYTVRLVDGDSSHSLKNWAPRRDGSLPNKFGSVSLFIDSGKIIGIDLGSTE